MADVNQLKKWLKMEDLHKGDTVEIMNGGEIKQFKFKDKQTGIEKESTALQISVSVNGSIPKEITLNNFSIKALQDKFGSDTDKWVGVKCTVDVAKTMSYGNIIDKNYIAPTEW